MSCAKVGDLIKFIKDGTFGGKIISKTEDKFILHPWRFKMGQFLNWIFLNF